MIFGSPVGLQIDLNGLAGQSQTLFQDIVARLQDGWEITVEAGGARGAVRNALIAKAQAHRRRDPFYLNPGVAVAILDLAQSALSSLVSSVRVAAAKAIEDQMLISIIQNVARQVNEGGSGFTPLTPGYAARKERKWGFRTPILRASGDLIDGLVTRSRRI